MPVMNGLEFVVAARANKDYRQMTLMMVTTESEHSQIVRALAPVPTSTCSSPSPTRPSPRS
jgi:CheY-like chemotaxis protein